MYQARSVMKHLRRWCALVGLGLGAVGLHATPPAAAQGDLGGLKAEVERLRSDVEALRGELRALRELVQQRLAQPPAAPAVTRSTVTVSGSPALGQANAPVTLVEFSDYQCQFCRRFFDQTLPDLKTQYIEPGKLRYVFRDFPIDSIHPHARQAAEASHCAGEQGKYWPMHDLLFQNQQSLQVDHLKGYATALGLDATTFGECLAKGTHRERVQQSFTDGINAGVRGTPAFFVGKTRSDGSVEGVLISGARPLSVFRQEIERLLTEK